MQVLFSGSEESPDIEGLGIVPGKIKRFTDIGDLSVPSIGWNGLKLVKSSSLLSKIKSLEDMVYFVHSFHAEENDLNSEWVLSKTNYGKEYIR